MHAMEYQWLINGYKQCMHFENEKREREITMRERYQATEEYWK